MKVKSIQMKNFSVLFLFILLASVTKAQNKSDREYIRAQTNVERLEEIAREYQENQKRFAGINIPQTTVDANGKTRYFSHFDENGTPIYCTLENDSSARSSKIDRIISGGSTGLDLDGSGVVIGLWDGGSPRVTHQELEGKIEILDAGTTTFHSTHVSGILVATGLISPSRGMASGAKIEAHTSQDWLLEIPLWAAGGGMITNHSYIIANPQEDYERFGIYNIHSQRWDELSYNAPYLMMVTGASNNGNNGYNPDNSRYDLLASNKLGKNSIVVGACSDVLDYTGPSSVSQAVFTSWGPTDDWRIKPDITAVGTNSYSTREASDNDYGTGQGSSYASPVVGGGLALLQQHYHNKNSVYMKNATAKALILSTTDEAGLHDGPDFSNGWGLFNAEKAAEVITNQGTTAEISELILNENQNYTKNITVDGTEPLLVSICWNDPPAEPLPNEIHNDPTSMLINDLDLRVSSASEEYFPWRMEPNDEYNNYTAAATKGDNFRDNIEIIQVNDIEAGEYVVNVSHKNSLLFGSQDFSLIINGIQTELTASEELQPEIITVYPNPVDDVINLDFETKQIGRFAIYDLSGKIHLNGAVNGEKSIDINIQNLSNGIYFLKVQDGDSKNIMTRKIVIQ